MNELNIENTFYESIFGKSVISYKDILDYKSKFNINEFVDKYNIIQKLRIGDLRLCILPIKSDGSIDELDSRIDFNNTLVSECFITSILLYDMVIDVNCITVKLNDRIKYIGFIYEYIISYKKYRLFTYLNFMYLIDKSVLRYHRLEFDTSMIHQDLGDLDDDCTNLYRDKDVLINLLYYMQFTILHEDGTVTVIICNDELYISLYLVIQLYKREYSTLPSSIILFIEYSNYITYIDEYTSLYVSNNDVNSKLNKELSLGKLHSELISVIRSSIGIQIITLEVNNYVYGYYKIILVPTRDLNKCDKYILCI